ncbi:CPBP family intramembrane glutamic endopeptidase [Halosimplex salinum]|uniref:CPBP family intramembrane glutamic endopeptidase n=1 Tax=Halosimplex salinum TaxID=1710538 RepID=UPI000F467DDB|nr:CPBP family intramembrane glutamic endopeptidase [Halosimplex salinum]
MASDESAGPSPLHGWRRASNAASPSPRVAVAVAVAAVVVSEGLLFTGRTWPAMWAHLVTLVGCVTVFQRADRDLSVLRVFALVPLFRLVTFGMPVFFEQALYWFPLVYGPFVPTVVLVEDTLPHVDVPIGARRDATLAPLAVPLGFALAEVEYAIVQPDALVAEWSVSQLLLVTVVMVGLVGFVEEYLFRGLLQGTLESELGRWPGLLVASGVFGLMHAGYGLYGELAFGVAVGLVFGLLYDYLDSLAFVIFVHGSLNVFLFAIIPMRGPFLL